MKTVKSPYLCNREIDYDKIWHSDTYSPPTNFEFLKIQNGGGHHLENHKNRDISATVWPIFSKFGMMMENRSLNLSDR